MPPLLETKNLHVNFPLASGWIGSPRSFVHAVNGVSLSLSAGEVLGIVGESGCGKTTLARAIVGLAPITEGQVLFKGRAASGLVGQEALAYRRNVQMIFQDPFDSLNPRKTVLETLSLPLRVHNIVPSADIPAEAVRLLNLVGLSPGENYLHRYPHQFSGGQRQRICIARALAVRPSVIVADEAVSALDISIRAQILALMRKLQLELGLAYLFITHDLGVVRSLCDRVAVMYLGRVVEEASTEELFLNSRHPYTSQLIGACPVPDPVLARSRQWTPLAGDPPSPATLPAGCHFHTRCPMAQDLCSASDPLQLDVSPQHLARCHFAANVSTEPAP